MTAFSPLPNAPLPADDVFTFEDANLEQTKARLALQGPGGSGKTLTALKIARGLAGPNGTIAVIDTENRTASKYSRQLKFKTLNLAPPFTPERYMKAMAAAQAIGADVLVIDSISHEWNGKGGILEMVDHYGADHKGDKWSAWKDLTPRHNTFVEALTRWPSHVIATMRSKTETVRETDDKGKTVIRKLGMAPIQRDGVEYEFDLIGDLDMDHVMRIIKSRFESFDGKSFTRPGMEVGEYILGQVSEGIPFEAVPRLINDLGDELVTEWRRVAREAKDHGIEVVSPKLPVWSRDLEADIARMEAALELLGERSAAEDVPLEPDPTANGEEVPA